MKSIDEIESILKEYTGGPIVLLAAQDAVKWALSYRQAAWKWCAQATREPINGLVPATPMEMTRVDIDARRIADTL